MGMKQNEEFDVKSYAYGDDQYIKDKGIKVRDVSVTKLNFGETTVPLNKRVICDIEP